MNRPAASLQHAATMLDLGEQAPRFGAPALDGNPDYAFDSAAGRPILMLFMGSGRAPGSAAALDLIIRHNDLFDDVNACFFGVTVDPTDAGEGRIAQRLPASVGSSTMTAPSAAPMAPSGTMGHGGSMPAIGCCSTRRCAASRGRRSSKASG